MLVSEFVQISDSLKDNHINFNIPRNNTIFRIYVESDEIVMSLKEKSATKSVYDFKSTSMLGKLD